MKKYLLTSLLIFGFCGNTIASASPSLAPPTLQNVMQKNETINKQVTKRKPVIRKTLTGSITMKSISYTTYFAGKSIILSRANEIDLWVQEVNL